MKKLILFVALSLLLVTIVKAEDVSFTPIFCNDYEFTCCNAYAYFDDARTKTQAQAIGCADTAVYCEALDIASGEYGYYVGSQNCRIEDPWYASPHYVCNNEVKYFSGSIRLEPGQKLYGAFRGIGTVEISYRFKAYSSKLVFCGRSGCTSGVTVLGADKCTFRPADNKIYTSTNSLTGKVITSSYSVPYQPPTNCVLAWQSGNRHICGYQEESCATDADCYGHTYNNKECYARTLQTYGCRSYGSYFAGEDRGPWLSGWGLDKPIPKTGDAEYGKRCEIINAISVQCCGDTDCGTNYFCDTKDFICKEKVECTPETVYKCGVSEQCDAFTTTYKKPVCRSGKCAFDERNVECCQDYNCPNGYYCDLNYECKKSECTPQVCMKECCIGVKCFIDKPCTSGQICCADQTCAISQDACEGGCVTESIEAKNCNDGEDNDCDKLVDANDPDCAVCVIDDMTLNLNYEQCCVKKGGTIKTTIEKPSWYKFWESEKTTKKCVKFGLSIPALIVTIIGLLMLGGMIYFQPLMWAAVPVTLIGLTWILIGYTFGIGIM